MVPGDSSPPEKVARWFRRTCACRKLGRVTQGGCPPRVPTDPDLRGIIPPLSHAPTVDGGQGELVVIIYSNEYIINISNSIDGDLTQGWP
jgi:hypothetical protein